MAYVGSHVWKLRQKVGGTLLLTQTVSMVPMDEQGRVKLVWAKHMGKWSLPGGHVEEGDSWCSAALNELREEVGLVAQKEDLEPFGAISGPGRIFHYQDGDTQPFTLCFLIQHWSKETAPEDEEEIARTKWFTSEELTEIEMTEGAKMVIGASREYLRTKKFQMVEVEREIEAD